MVVIADVEHFEEKIFVVTGGAGYFGRRLCVELSRRAAKEVRCFDRNLEKAEELQGVENVKLIKGDVRREESVRQVVEGADCVFHCTSFGDSGKEMMRESEMHSVNLDGTLAVLQACVRAGVPRLVYTSTYSVVFGGKPIVNGDETREYFPVVEHVDSYGPTKALAEQLVLRFNRMAITTSRGKAGRLRTCALRPAAMFGPGEELRFPRLMRLFRLGLYRFVIGRGDARVDWVHVDNAVHAHCLAFAGLHVERRGQEEEEEEEGVVEKEKDEKRAPAEGKAYFISDDAPVNYFEFLRPIVEAYGRKMPTARLSVEIGVAFAWIYEWTYRLFHASFFSALLPAPFILPAEVYKVGVTHYFSIARARMELGYHPVVDPKDGLRQMTAFWRQKARSEVSRPGAAVCFLIPLGMYFLFLAAFSSPPSMGALEVLRDLGLFLFVSISGLQIVFGMAVAIHVVEALVAWAVARGMDSERENASEWGLQTLIFGFWSLRLLLRRLMNVSSRLSDGKED